MEKTALVVGATGLVGNQLVNLLLESGNYKRITVLVREKMTIRDPKLEQQVIDFRDLGKLSPDLVKNATIFCTLGTTMKKAKTKENFKRVDYDYPMILGGLASRHGAEQMLIVTAMGANPKSLFFYNQVKGQVERDLQELKLHKLHIFRPSLIVGDRQEHRRGEELAANIARKLPFLFKAS